MQKLISNLITKGRWFLRLYGTEPMAAHGVKIIAQRAAEQKSFDGIGGARDVNATWWDELVLDDRGRLQIVRTVTHEWMSGGGVSAADR